MRLPIQRGAQNVVQLFGKQNSFNEQKNDNKLKPYPQQIAASINARYLDRNRNRLSKIARRAMSCKIGGFGHRAPIFEGRYQF